MARMDGGRYLPRSGLLEHSGKHVFFGKLDLKFSFKKQTELYVAEGIHYPRLEQVRCLRYRFIEFKQKHLLDELTNSLFHRAPFMADQYLVIGQTCGTGCFGTLSRNRPH